MRQALLRIAIGGFDGLEAQGPGLSVARALRASVNRPMSLIAVGADGLLTGAWLPDVVDGLRTVPDAQSDPDGFTQALLQIAREGQVSIYLPGTTAEVLALLRARTRLARQDLSCPLPPPNQAHILNRRGQVRLLRDLGFAVPFSQHVDDMQEVRFVADQIGYPVVVLGILSGATIAYNGSEAESAARRLMTSDGVMVRSALPGDGLNVALVADAKARIRGMVTMRRLLADPVGLPAFGAVVEDDEISEAALRIQKATEWQGPLEIDFVRASNSGRLFVTDLRPTLPNWSMLTHWSGCSLPALALSLAAGTPRSAQPKPGVMFARGVEEVPVPLESFRRIRQGPAKQNVVAAPLDGRPPLKCPADLGGNPGLNVTINSKGRFDLRKAPSASVNGISGSQPVPASGQRHFGKAKIVHGADRDGLRVAVTGMGTFGVVNPGLGAARALRGAEGIRTVYGLGYGTLDSGAYQTQLCDLCLRLPPTDAVEPLYQRLAEIQAQHPIDVLIPCLDLELPRFIAIQDRLRAIGISMLIPTQRALERRSKLALFSGRFAADWGGFHIPESRIVRTEAEALRAAAALGLPVVLKGPVSLCIPARTTSEVRSAWMRLRADGASRVVVQQYLEGDIFATAAVCNRQARPLAMTTIKKAAICARGSTWSAIHVPNPRLEESFAAFLHHIGWHGPVEGEFIRDRVTDRFYLFEINPRFTAWIGFTAMLGSNHPRVTALAAAGCTIPTVADNDSVMFMRSGVEVLVRPAGLAAFSTRGELSHA